MAISEAWFHRLKAATRDLVKVCGGVVRAGEISGYSKTEVGRWQSATDTDVIPIPAALALEADSGRAFVSSVMAELNGRRLGEPGRMRGRRRTLPGRMPKWRTLSEKQVSSSRLPKRMG